jgi:hypothetical protein
MSRVTRTRGGGEVVDDEPRDVSRHPDARQRLLTVYIRIKLHMNLQADKSPVVVKEPFFPRVVNPRYQIRGTMCNARIQSSKAKKSYLMKNQVASNLRYHQENTSNLIY